MSKANQRRFERDAVWQINERGYPVSENKSGQYLQGPDGAIGTCHHGQVRFRSDGIESLRRGKVSQEQRIEVFKSGNGFGDQPVVGFCISCTQSFHGIWHANGFQNCR